MAAKAQRWESGRCDDDGGGGEVAESDLGSEGPQYSGTDTGDTQVVKLSCVGTRRPEREIGKGHERADPPDGHRVVGGNDGAVPRRIAT